MVREGARVAGLRFQRDVLPKMLGEGRIVSGLTWERVKPRWSKAGVLEVSISAGESVATRIIRSASAPTASNESALRGLGRPLGHQARPILR